MEAKIKITQRALKERIIRGLSKEEMTLKKLRGKKPEYYALIINRDDLMDSMFRTFSDYIDWCRSSGYLKPYEEVE